jgi:hypothetical protein
MCIYLRRYIHECIFRYVYFFNIIVIIIFEAVRLLTVSPSLLLYKYMYICKFHVFIYVDIFMNVYSDMSIFLNIIVIIIFEAVRLLTITPSLLLYKYMYIYKIMCIYLRRFTHVCIFRYVYFF